MENWFKVLTIMIIIIALLDSIRTHLKLKRDIKEYKKNKPTIGSIKVKLELDTQSFEDALERAHDNFNIKYNAYNHIDSEKLFNCIPNEVKDELIKSIQTRIESDILDIRSDKDVQ